MLSFFCFGVGILALFYEFFSKSEKNEKYYCIYLHAYVKSKHFCLLYYLYLVSF